MPGNIRGRVRRRAEGRNVTLSRVTFAPNEEQVIRAFSSASALHLDSDFPASQRSHVHKTYNKNQHYYCTD